MASEKILLNRFEILTSKIGEVYGVPGQPSIPSGQGKKASVTREVPKGSEELSRSLGRLTASGMGRVHGIAGRSLVAPRLTVCGVSDTAEGHLSRTLEEVTPPPLALLQKLYELCV